jgi:hypothetical protein
MLDLFVQFVIELLRALLVDELSGHVRKKVYAWFGRRAAKANKKVLLAIHRQNRNRILNKLLTESAENP